MQTNISPEFRSDPALLAAVERAELNLRSGLRGPIEGRTWTWVPAQDRCASLVMDYEGNTASRQFSVAELANARDVVWAAGDLWADVIVANIRRTSDVIVGLLREVAHEELLQGV